MPRLYLTACRPAHVCLSHIPSSFTQVFLPLCRITHPFPSPRGFWLLRGHVVVCHKGKIMCTRKAKCHAVVASWRRVAECLWVGGVREARVCQSCHVTCMACVHWRAGCSAGVTTLWPQPLILLLRERHEGSTDNFIWVDFRPYCGVHYDF